MTRGLLRAVCRGLVGVVLFAQMSIAAYACPQRSLVAMSASASVAVAPAEGALGERSSAASDPASNCEGMVGTLDPALPNLCAEHCHYGQQSDQSSTLAVPAVVLTALYFTPLAAVPVVALRPAAAPSALAAAFPPHAILHCCWRI